MASTTTRERIETWREAGPIRKWRTKNDLSMQDAALLFGASLTGVQKWESGVNAPAEHRLPVLATVMKYRSVEHLQRTWQQWFDARPTS
jgi:DNA-binding transcriptional regulator YiaG